MTIFQVTHKMVWLNQQCRNIYYYESSPGDPTDIEWQDIANEIRLEYNDELKTLLHSDWEFQGIDYRVVSTAGLPTFSVTPGLGTLSGTSGGQSLPTQIALLVSVKANTVKPRNGRSYLCGFTENGMVEGFWGSTYTDAGEVFVNNIRELNSTGTNTLTRVAVQWNSNHTQVVAYNTIPAGGSVASSVPATQRRRRIGVGI